MAEAALPLLNLAILGSFMVGGAIQLGQLSNTVIEENKDA